MTKEMPTCKKCGLQHWYFADCSEGRKFVRVGYDTIRHSTDYQRLQYRQRPRLHYRESDPGGPDAA